MKTRLKEIRRVLGLSQDDFATKLGMSRSYISQIESVSEKAVVTDKTIKLICEKCSINEEWLRTGKGEMFAKRSKNEIVVDFLAEILNEPNESYKRRFIEALAKMTPTEWAEMERTATRLLTNGIAKGDNFDVGENQNGN